MNTLTTISGKSISLLDPQPEDITIQDIAWGLSHIPRFNGQLSQRYTVADHSIFVSMETEDIEGLLHDGSEAFLCDVPSPLKTLLPEYRVIEARFMTVIADKFGFPYPMSQKTKTADLALREEEGVKFTKREPNWIISDYSYVNKTNYLSDFTPKEFFDLYQSFLDRFNDLK